MSALPACVGALALGLVGLGLWQERGPDARRSGADSPRYEAAERALAQASTHKRALIGASGARRDALRQTAVEAYRSVLTEHAGAPRICAEAAYRAGELLRAAGRAEEARIEFRTAVRVGEGTPFRARAGLELGHLARRSGHTQDALREYERVRLDPLADLEHRHEGTWWAGRVHAAEGRVADAARLFECVARDAEDPLDQIRGFDAWAALLAERGDVEGAAGVLEQCRLGLRDRALEETRFGARVRATLEGMRARELVERAVAERRARKPLRLVPPRYDAPPFERVGPPPMRAPHLPTQPPDFRGMGSSSPPPFPPTGF